MCSIPLTPHQAPETNISRLFELNFDPILYKDNQEYQSSYREKACYYCLSAIGLNKGITINQLSSLLRNVLNVPLELTQSTVVLLENADLITRYKYKKDTDTTIVHLSIKPSAEVLMEQLCTKYVELREWCVPNYRHK
jgi:hypothetical protein